MRHTYQGKILQGKFVCRKNRFIAEVEVDGEVVLSHLKNTGRMRELLVKGATCYIMEAKNKNRKTKYDFLSIDHEGRLINLDSQVPNKVIADGFLNGEISGWEDIDFLKREVQVGSSRLDMVLEKCGDRLYVEVKGVDLMLGKGRASFPDAPTSRGSKHLKELAALVEAGAKAMVIFCLHRDDAVDFRPNYKMDPEFFNNFYDALDKGVEARAYTCKVGPDYIELDKEIKILNRDQALREFEEEKNESSC